jgi:hypothetical protein
MDIISHGLWGGVAFGRKSRRNFFIAFFIGMMPDLFAFSGPFISRFLGFSQGPQYSNGRPDFASIPNYVFQLYDISHSLIVFALVFGAVWIWRKKPQWLLGAWVLHILVDIPSHSAEFFPTPLFWPLSDFRVDGINWGNPIIYIPNLTLLTVAYVSWYVADRKKDKKH